MKFLETHFNEYIQSSKNVNLHPSLHSTFNKFPKKICDLKNIIFYGPPGVGKYTQMLNSIQQYSPSELKYEKKLTCTYNKYDYIFKISDIHFEIDMSLLGCHSKLLWNDIFITINDVLSSRSNSSGIIVCKNFHKIHNELLDCFYSYIQCINKNVNITYILLTEHISFIPENILNCFFVINMARPNKTSYNKILNKKLNSKINITSIYNIKNIITNTNSFINNINTLIDKIMVYIKDPESINYLHFRDLIYDIFIYDMDINYIIWKIIYNLEIIMNIPKEIISDIYLDTYIFFQYYNNNYRPIYHLENYLYTIINKVHGF